MTDFNSERFYLGSLCKNSHNFNESGKSLRRLSNKICIQCEQENKKIYRKQNKKHIIAQSLEYQNKCKKQRIEKARFDLIENPLLSNEIGFDSTRYYLGGLCPLGHNFNNSSQSLRYLCDTGCIKCKALYREKTKYKNCEYQQKYRNEHPQSKVYYAAYRARNKERYLEYARQYRTKYKAGIKTALSKYFTTPEGRKLRLKHRLKREQLKNQNHYVDFTTNELQQRFDMFDSCCAYCDKSNDLTIEHFIPISKSGSDCLGNIIPACRSCNSSKKDHDPKEWFERQPFYSKARWNKILKVLGKTDYRQMPLF